MRSAECGTKSPRPVPRPPAARHRPGAAATGTEPTATDAEQWSESTRSKRLPIGLLLPRCMAAAAASGPGPAAAAARVARAYLPPWPAGAQRTTKHSDRTEPGDDTAGND